MTTDVIIKILQNQMTNGIVEITDVLAKEIIDKLQKYDKALDEATKLMEDNFDTCPNNLNTSFEHKGDCSKNCRDYCMRECWKEYLLKESEKE